MDYYRRLLFGFLLGLLSKSTWHIGFKKWWARGTVVIGIQLLPCEATSCFLFEQKTLPLPKSHPDRSWKQVELVKSTTRTCGNGWANMDDRKTYPTPVDTQRTSVSRHTIVLACQNLTPLRTIFEIILNRLLPFPDWKVPHNPCTQGSNWVEAEVEWRISFTLLSFNITIETHF